MLIKQQLFGITTNLTLHAVSADVLMCSAWANVIRMWTREQSLLYLSSDLPLLVSSKINILSPYKPKVLYCRVNFKWLILILPAHPTCFLFFYFHTSVTFLWPETTNPSQRPLTKRCQSLSYSTKNIKHWTHRPCRNDLWRLHRFMPTWQQN